MIEMPTSGRKRIYLIHALRHSIAPIDEAFKRLWPEADHVSLLDDSLSTDVARAGALTADMDARFLALGRYAVQSGAAGILFTCSAFGSCIDKVKEALSPLPVFKPNEAMIVQAAGMAKTIGLLASFEPTLQSMPDEFPRGVEVVPCLARGALAALETDPGEHDRLAAIAAQELSGCEVIALAQFSLARAANAVAAATGRPVLTTPDCAVRAIRAAVEA